MSVELPRVEGPRDLPELRRWLVDHWRPGGVLSVLDREGFMAHNLPTAKLWWVEAETCDMLASAAPTWPDDAVLDIADLPTPCGLAVFEHDFVGTDADPEAEGREVWVSAVLWAPASIVPRPGGAPIPRTGVSISIFSRLVMDDGLTPEETSWSAHDLSALAERLRDARRGEQHESVTGHLFSWIGRTDWFEGWGPSRVISDNPHGDDPHTACSMAEDRKLLASLWALSKTRFVESTTTRPQRHIARRSERKGLSADVHVLSLGGERTRHPAGHTAAAVDWKHSWIVSPHWRWQPCGPGRSERKLTLIPAYQKGPADKPLIGGERVWRVRPPKPKDMT